MFSKLNELELKSLEKISTIKDFSDGDILFYEDEMSNNFYFLLDGQVEIYKVNVKGKIIILNQFFSFEFIAEVSNYNNMKFPATGKSIGNSKVLIIDYEVFKKEFLYHKEIAPFIIESLANKVMGLNNIISSQLTMDASQRVAKFIYNNEKCLTCIKHHKIAENLNITPVTFSRILKTFKNENIIYEEENMLVIKKELLKKQFS